jgi:hypothetical protein
VWTKIKHHKIFVKFHRWSGRAPAGYEVDFLGSKYRTAYFTMHRPQPAERYEAPEHPPYDEEYFEWIDLLEAVASAKNRFTMLELGAGWGRWSARAAAVTGKDGKVGFHVGEAATDYGQAIGGTTEIASISLPTLLLPLDLVDLIDLDVKGAELEIISAATRPLAQKVKRIHVETDSEQLHLEIHRLFRRLGWKPHFLYEGNTADDTPWGRINFQGGTQSWLNPRLNSAAELRDTPTLQNSLGRRSLTAGRRVLNRVAPVGTARRKAFTTLISPLTAKYRRDPQDASNRPVDWHQL